MTPSWNELHRLNIRILWASLAVLATYSLAAGTLGWAGYHHEIGIRTAATMLLMLPARASTPSSAARSRAGTSCRGASGSGLRSRAA